MRTAPTDTFDAVISDIRMPRMDGMQLLHALAQEDPELPVILLTAHGSVDSAVEAVKAGAFDYLEKPFEIEQIKAVLGKAIAAGTASSKAVTSPSPRMLGATNRHASDRVVYTTVLEAMSTIDTDDIAHVGNRPRVDHAGEAGK